MSTPLVATESLGLVIGGATIVADVSLAVPPGEFLGVIGPNGAGKTTLLNLLSGLRRPTEGRIFVDGVDVTTHPVHERARVGLGRTFQTSSLFLGLSARENVRLSAQAHTPGGVSVLRRPRRSDDAAEVAAHCLAEVGLSGRADIPAGQLSHGERRKLEIAVLLAAHPKVMLLDEPMAGVASGDVAELTELLRRLHSDQARTVVMVEHHLPVVLGLVDRVAVLHHGRLLDCAAPDAVIANPAVQRAYLGEALSA